MCSSARMEPFLPEKCCIGRSRASPSRSRRSSGRVRRVPERLLGSAMLDRGLFDRGAWPGAGRAPAGRFDHSLALWLLLVFEGFLAGETSALRETAGQGGGPGGMNGVAGARPCYARPSPALGDSFSGRTPGSEPGGLVRIQVPEPIFRVSSQPAYGPLDRATGSFQPR